MKLTKHLILTSTALSCAVTFTTYAHAKPIKQQVTSPVKVINSIDMEKSEQNFQPIYKAADLKLRQECKKNNLRGFEPNPMMTADDKSKNTSQFAISEDGFNFQTECPQAKEQGNIQEAEVRLSGYGRFGLGYNEVSSRTEDANTATNNNRITAFGGISRYRPAQVGYGVDITGGEKFAARTDATLDGYSIGSFIKLGDGRLYKNGVYLVSAQYSEADGSSEGQIANGTSDVGFVYHGFAPSGSTGINIGNRGLDVRTDTITSRLRIQFDMSTETDGGVSFGSRIRSQTAVGAGAIFSDTSHRANVTTPSFNDISSSSTQKIDENSYYLNGYSTLSFEPDGKKKGKFGLYITPRIEVGYRDANLDSRQTNICGLCGAADQNFNVNIKDEDNGIYYDLSLNANIGYHISDKVIAGIGGNIGWRNKTAQIVNPENGDDLFIRNNPTHLESESEYSQSLSAWFSAEF